MNSDAVQLHWIWRETVNKVAVFERRVQEGKDVMAASEFARFIKCCGLIGLLKANDRVEPLKVDGALLEWKLDELLRLCNERFRTCSIEPNLNAAYVQTLHEKVDLIAGYVSRLSVGQVAVGSGNGGDASEGAGEASLYGARVGDLVCADRRG